MTTKLDELKALMAKATPGQLDIHSAVLANAAVKALPALIAAVEALKQIADVCGAQRRRSARPAVCVIAEWENIARAAVAPFGE